VRGDAPLGRSSDTPAPHLRPGGAAEIGGEIAAGVAGRDLGNVLWRQDKLDEALELFDRALSIDDGHFLAVFNRGMLLADLGRLDDAIASYRRARKLEPKNGMVALYLGEALRRKGDPNEAIPLLQESLTLHADAFLAHRALGAIFAGQGRNSEAADAFRNAAASKPDDALVQVLLGEALLKCHETAAAEEAFRKAVELQADNAHAHCGLALALRENGKYAEALVAMKRGHELGVKQPNWAFPSAEWLQEAEQLAELESRLPSILQHELTPESAEARLRYAVMSSNKRMPRDAARLYAGAFTSNPGLADDYQAQHRYNAARAAAAAARCETVPSDNLSDAERSGLRRQALDWLSAELTAWTKHLEQNPKLKHTDLARLLRRWQQEPDLASLREPAAQANLPTEERKAWQKLWVDVENLRKRAQG